MAGAREGRRIIHHRFGDPQEVLEVENAITPGPLGDGDVLVRVSRSTIHPGDLQLIAAKYSEPGQAIPMGRIPGLEAAGIVVDAAPGALDASDLSPGCRVAFFAPQAWQTYAVVSAASLIAIPDGLSDEIAAQLLVNSLTARHVLRAGLQGMPSRPRRIVQTGAASAVGKLITAFALQEGLEPVRLVRSRASAARLAQSLPGGHIIDMEADGWQAAVRDAARGELALVFDGVGGSLIGEMAKLLEIKGRIVSYGLLEGTPAELTLFVPKALSLLGATIGTWAADAAPDVRVRDMRAAIEVGCVEPRIFADYREFELSDLSRAIGAVTEAGKRGNAILKF